MHWDIPGLCSQWFSTQEPPEKMFLSENVILRELRLGHFGQQAPESPVSRLQNGRGNNVKLVMHQISVDKTTNPCY